MHSKPIGEICRRLNFLYHCFADDTQVYMVIRPFDKWGDISARLEACLSDISSWISINKLKLNHEKTELIVFSSHQRMDSTRSLKMKTGFDTVEAVHSVKNLGVIFDSDLTMESQINSVSRAYYYHIRNIGRIR